MSTKSTTRSRGAKPRRVGILALVASMTLAMAGLVGLGLAPAASAAPPSVCPENSSGTNPDGSTWVTVWTLDGDECEGITTTTATKPANPEVVGTDCTSYGDKYAYNPVSDKCERPNESGWWDGWRPRCPQGGTPVGFSEVTADDVEAATYPFMCSFPSKDAKGDVPANCVFKNAQSEEHNNYQNPWKGPKDGVCTKTTTTKEERDPTCPAGEELEQLVEDSNWKPGYEGGDESELNCVPIPEEPPTVVTGQEPPVTVYSSATASGTVDLCLTDGSSPTVAYSGSAEGSGITPGDADYVANTEAVKAAMADLAAKTPAGATLGACGAPVAQATPTVVANAAAAATVAEPAAANIAAPAAATAAAPEAATVPAAVPAGDGSDSGLPMWALAFVALGVLGAAAAGKQLVGSQK